MVVGVEINGSWQLARHVPARFRLGAIILNSIPVESEPFPIIIMAPVSRIGAIASRKSLHITSPSSYTCLKCRLLSYRAAQKSNSSTKYLPSRRHASGFINTEKWRKKIWGSENPPGQEDPYGPPGALDQRRREQGVEDPEQSAKEVETSVGDLDDAEEDITPRGPHYKRATTWEGLERVGYRNWGKEQFDEEHPFEGFDILDKAIT